jgi:type IV pilus assembly protein PilM
VRRVLPIGIDVGTCRAKLVQLVASGGAYSVGACAKVDLPDLAGMMAEVREGVLIERIRAKLKERKFRKVECISALQDHEVSIRNIRVPCVGERELEAAVREEAKSKFPFDVDKALLRFLVAGEVRHGEDTRLEVILFAAPEEAVENHIRRLQRMELTPVSLDVQHCAMFRTFERYLRRKEDENEVNVFVDLGGITKVVITQGRDILFIKNINKGAMTFNEAVASRLGISVAEATALRWRVAQDGSAAGAENCGPEIRQALVDAIRPEVEELADEINKCLRYYNVTFRGARPQHLTFVGGESHDGDIPARLGQRLGYTVVIGQPFRGISTEKLGPDLDRRGMLSEWAVAFGLSLKGAFIQGSEWGRKQAS